MYCKKCGTELRENDIFCYHCGYKTSVLQRIVSSKAFVGSVIAILFVAIAGILAYLIMTGKVKLPTSSNQPSVVENQEKPGIPAQTTEKVKSTEAPTATPYVFSPTVVTDTMKTEMKPLLERLKPFLSYSASFYADGSHAFHWDDASATTMALYNLEHYDKSVKYGDSMSTIKKKAKQEMKKIFGTYYKYNFRYGGSYPGYVYRPTGNTMVFNSVRIPGKNYNMKTKKITEYEQGRYRIVVVAYLSSVTDGTKGDSQKYTVTAEQNEESKLGYVVSKIKLSR